jgi:hypothetical protein
MHYNHLTLAAALSHLNNLSLVNHFHGISLLRMRGVMLIAANI